MSWVWALLAASTSPEDVTSQHIQDNVDRAKRSMGYIWCLYGTKGPDGIVGLPERARERASFVTFRVKECAKARQISEDALLEAAAQYQAPLNNQVQSVRRELVAVDNAFRENVLHPRRMQSKVRNFEKCLEKHGAEGCG